MSQDLPTQATANAKVNFGLRVEAPRSNGLHLIRGVFQSIDWTDEVALVPAETDAMVVSRGSAPSDESNLAWRAVDAVRTLAGLAGAVRVTLSKSVPPGAGLGGGSADAAAALILASRRFGVGFDDMRSLAYQLGADVPFALVGGTAIVGGIGELVSPEPDAEGFALAIVVPDLLLETPTVYEAWDRLEGPSGPAHPEASLPPSLRRFVPLANDLYPAAVAVAPELDDWRAELEGSWGTPVAMTGSGSGLFGYFPTIDEAEDAVGVVPIPTRAVKAAVPVDHGWRLLEERVAE